MPSATNVLPVQQVGVPRAGACLAGTCGQHRVLWVGLGRAEVSPLGAPRARQCTIAYTFRRLGLKRCPRLSGVDCEWSFLSAARAVPWDGLGMEAALHDPGEVTSAELGPTEVPESSPSTPQIDVGAGATPEELRVLEEECIRVGLTGGRLALQTGAELAPAAAQICEAAGPQLRAELVRAFEALVLTAATPEPLAERVRGEEGPALEPTATAEAAEVLHAQGRQGREGTAPLAVRPPRGKLDRRRVLGPRPSEPDGPGGEAPG